MKGRSENFGWTLAFELTPAAIFGSAAGFAASKALGLPPADPTVLGGGFAAFCASWLFLRLFRGKSDDYVIPMFDLGAFDRELAAAAEAAEQDPPFADEPKASDDRLEELQDSVDEPDVETCVEPVPAEDELILDDILTDIDPAARVVRLFRKNDTAGELQARIERHLRDVPRPVSPPDATQELHEALAALRRSLR